MSVSPESNIVFNFFSNASPATTPYAIGTGFLLSMEYLGSPNGLSSATPGYLGQAAASGGFYTFNSSLTLAPATQYYFYESAGVNSGISFGGVYAGGHLYNSGGVNDPYNAGDTQSTNFQVTGIPTTNGVPDGGSTWILLLLGLTGVLGLRFFARRLA